MYIKLRCKGTTFFGIFGVFAISVSSVVSILFAEMLKISTAYCIFVSSDNNGVKVFIFSIEYQLDSKYLL